MRKVQESPTWEDRLGEMKAKLSNLQGAEAEDLQNKIEQLKRAIALRDSISTDNGKIDFAD